MLPAGDEVAALRLMVEVAAAELELDPHALVAASAFHVLLRFAIVVAGLPALDYEAKVVRDRAEEEDDALLVDRRMLEGVEVVASLMTSLSQISGLESPRASRSRTSRSRGVSSSTAG